MQVKKAGSRQQAAAVIEREMTSKSNETLPDDADVVAFQCRNPVHRAHYELFTRALDAPNVGEDAVVLVHPTCGPSCSAQGVWYSPAAADVPPDNSGPPQWWPAPER